MHCCENNRIFKFLLERWTKIEEISNTLKIFYDLTIQLQKVDCTLSDFYSSWFLCELKIKKWIQSGIYQSTDLCEKLAFSMNKRKPDLVGSEAMLCTLFIDPRFKSNMSTSDIALAKNILSDLWIDLANLNKAPDTDREDDNNNNNMNLNLPVILEEDLLENFFVEREREPITTVADITNNAIQNLTSIPCYNKTRNDFIAILNDYEGKVKRLHHTHSVRKFWLESKELYPELYQVAMVCLGIPPTQSSTERSFSTLSYIFNVKRSKLSKSLLENIMLTKSNKETAFQIFLEDLDEIEKNV